MNNYTLGYSFSSKYFNHNGKISTSHNITKMNNDSIVTEKYRNNQLVEKSIIPFKSNVSTKNLQKNKLTGINLGRQINSKKSTLKMKKSPKKTPKKILSSVKKTTRKIRSPTRKRSVKSKGLRGKKTKRKNN